MNSIRISPKDVPGSSKTVDAGQNKWQTIDTPQSKSDIDRPSYGLGWDVFVGDDRLVRTSPDTNEEARESHSSGREEKIPSLVAPPKRKTGDDHGNRGLFGRSIRKAKRYRGKLAPHIHQRSASTTGNENVSRKRDFGHGDDEDIEEVRGLLLGFDFADPFRLSSTAAPSNTGSQSSSATQTRLLQASRSPLSLVRTNSPESPTIKDKTRAREKSIRKAMQLLGPEAAGAVVKKHAGNWTNETRGDGEGEVA